MSGVRAPGRAGDARRIVGRGSMKTTLLAFRQVPIILRAFFRQGNQVFWNYGFFLLMLFFACSLFAQGDPKSMRPLLGTTVMALALLSGGIYGVSYGMWNFFRGGVVERYLRSPWRASAPLAFLMSRFLILFSAVLVQAVALVFIYGVGVVGAGGWTALIACIALSDACCVLVGFCMVTLSRAHYRSYLFSNLVFVCLVVMGGVAIPLGQMPLWVARAGLLLPSAHITLAISAILAGGAGWWGAGPHLVCLCAWTAGLGVVAWWTFDWMVLDRAR